MKNLTISGIILEAALAMIIAAPGHAAAVDDAAALAMTRPQEQIAAQVPKDALASLLRPVDAFYAFWINGSPALLARAIGSDFVDHTLPAGRLQGPTGPAQASRSFLEAVPDLRLTVLQRLIVGDRVVSHLRFTGDFTGKFAGTPGTGQPVDFIATDVLRLRGGRITDNWHLEDNLAFLQQIGVIAK